MDTNEYSYRSITIVRYFLNYFYAFLQIHPDGNAKWSNFTGGSWLQELHFTKKGNTSVLCWQLPGQLAFVFLKRHKIYNTTWINNREYTASRNVGLALSVGRQAPTCHWHLLRLYLTVNRHQHSIHPYFDLFCIIVLIAMYNYCTYLQLGLLYNTYANRYSKCLPTYNKVDVPSTCRP